MDTLRAHTSDIIMIANRLGSIQRRNDIDSREVEKWIREYRSKWIIDNFQRNRKLYFTARQSLVQDLGCILLDCVDQSECTGLPTGSFVSKAIVPAPVEIDGAMDYVGAINKRYRFIGLSSANELAGKLAAPYSNKFIFWWPGGGGTVIYLATQDTEAWMDLCYINVRMIVADPTKACYKKSLSSEVCCYDKGNNIYPCTDDMMTDIKFSILTREMNIASNYVRDWTNNNRDDRQAELIQRPGRR